MLRVRPGVELVRASFVPTSELITLDFPTLDRPRKAISGIDGAGKCATSVAAARKRVNTLILKCAMQCAKLASVEKRVYGEDQDRPPRNVFPGSTRLSVL